MKILVISHNSFSPSSNNGKTLESIFSWVDKENLAQLFLSENESPDYNFCYNYYKMTDMDMLKSIKGKKDGKLIRNKNISEKNIPTRINKNNFFTILKNIFKDRLYLRELLWQKKLWNSPYLDNWLKEFNPDVIFYVGGNLIFSHKIVNNISNRLNIPLISYFTDDYIINPIYKGIFNKFYKKKLIENYRQTINHSSICFVIGEKMAKEYKKYFNKNFEYIMNAIHISDFIEYKSENDRKKIAYFGGLHLDRDKSIIKLAEAIHSFADILVYTTNEVPKELQKRFNSLKIINKGPVYGTDLLYEMSKCDYFLHVESDDEYYKSLTKLSVSTKIPEYLVNCKPIIGFGPTDVASMQILTENNIGYVINSSNQIDEIKNSILNIISQKNNNKDIVQNGYRFAEKEFDIKEIQNRFKNKIEKLDNENRK